MSFLTDLLDKARFFGDVKDITIVPLPIPEQNKLDNIPDANQKELAKELAEKHACQLFTELQRVEREANLHINVISPKLKKDDNDEFLNKAAYDAIEQAIKTSYVDGGGVALKIDKDPIFQPFRTGSSSTIIITPENIPKLIEDLKKETGGGDHNKNPTIFCTTTDTLVPNNTPSTPLVEASLDTKARG